jgi:aconitate hydratase
VTGINSFKTLSQLTVNGLEYDYFSLPALQKAGFADVTQLPYSLKVLLENLLRFEDNLTVERDDILALKEWLQTKRSDREIAYRPTRVLMQDFTGVPAVVDLGAMRDAIKKMGGNPTQINPLSPVDLVIDHSIQVDEFATKNAINVNAHMEMERNKERYVFLRWGQTAFDNFRVVPPDTGICHQVNLEYLAKAVWDETKNGRRLAYPDTLVGTDSHTTMINGLGVLGWGVGGIEAEAAMLGQPISMLIPEVVGVKLSGKLRDGVTATDLVLTLTEMLRKKGVVGKFVEYFGPGLHDLPVADRATIANMSPEYGATCGFFPIDATTLDYLRLTSRDKQTVDLVEAYAKAQGLWHDKNSPEPHFSDVVELNLSQVEPSLAGPKRPQDRVTLPELHVTFNQLLTDAKREHEKGQAFKTADNFDLHHGDVVIAAITSCTNTSNPSVLMAAGLVAKKALEKGLKTKPWVKTSLAPGSQVVTQYLKTAGLDQPLNQLGFDLVGYGCTTCIGNSGPLPDAISDTVDANDLIVSAVLSGNRNFEGRIHPQVKANWLASPPLVVVFALAGTTNLDLTSDPIANDKDNKPVYLKDLWPTNSEVANEVAKVTSKMFSEQYTDVFSGNQEWQTMKIPTGETYTWHADSTYIQLPPFFTDMGKEPSAIKSIENASILAILGDSITTDHISPAGSIKPDSPAGKYLQSKGVAIKDFNSYGARRGNHEVMMRGTFANIRIKNEMVPGVEGGFTKHYPSQEVMSIFDAAMRYQAEHIPLVIIAGKEYGTGSSRDWAAKGPKLQGVSAVIAESFERIHRSNLIGMGILPLQFKDGMTRKSLNLIGNEKISIVGLDNGMKHSATIKAIFQYADGTKKEVMLQSRIDTQNEVEYYRHGGILHFVLRNMLKRGS